MSVKLFSMMQQVKKKMMTCSETVIENSFGKRILFNKLRVPKGYNVADFNLTVSVRDLNSTEITFTAPLSKTAAEHVADLTGIPMIVVPDAKLLTVKVTPPGIKANSKIQATLFYEHS